MIKNGLKSLSQTEKAKSLLQEIQRDWWLMMAQMQRTVGYPSFPRVHLTLLIEPIHSEPLISNLHLTNAVYLSYIWKRKDGGLTNDFQYLSCCFASDERSGSALIVLQTGTETVEQPASGNCFHPPTAATVDSRFSVVTISSGTWHLTFELSSSLLLEGWFIYSLNKNSNHHP